MARKYCIGFLGADWWGSDARAVAMEFRHQGHVLIERNYEDYLPTKWRGSIRVLRRLFRNWMKSEYNKSVTELLKIDGLDFLLAFKGMLLEPATLKKFIDRGVPCYCLYPDVSFQDHGNTIWRCIPLYDCVFTTKCFHVNDPKVRDKTKQLRFVRHGFDPAVHRPIETDAGLSASYGCDLSFVGVWSPKKEAILTYILKCLPELDIRIWGPVWEKSASPIRSKWQGRGAYGDEASAIYSLSKINLGLLSEAGTGTQAGDQTTARTWQIPAAGGFMLHEHTKELQEFFEANHEVATFSSQPELIEKIEFYLSNEEDRNRVRSSGHERCHREPYTYRSAVNSILKYHELTQADRQQYFHTEKSTGK